MPSQNLRGILAPLLFPISMIYGLAVGVRNKLFDLRILRSHIFDIPVICVGNITVGGTGKTPHVEYLVELLSGNGLIAVLSRGYKRKTKGYIEAGKETGPGIIGDEPYQLFQKFNNIKVAVDEDRVRGIRKLCENKKEISAVILDDAFQHRYVEAGINIVLVDYNRPVFDDFLLPFGNLREHQSAMCRANIVIVTKVPHFIKPIEKRIWIKQLRLFPYQFLYFTTFEYGHLKMVFSLEQKEFLMEDLKSTAVLMVAGIANPAGLFSHLKNSASKVEKLIYADHYFYETVDLLDIQERFNKLEGNQKIIITTEKDAVKLRQLENVEESLKSVLYYIPIRVKFLGENQREFEEKVINYVSKNRKISRLHP